VNWNKVKEETMSENLTLLALFQDLNPAAAGIKKLHEMGIHDDSINVHSGIPFKAAILGRPNPKTNVPRIGVLGAGLGMCLGLFFIQGIPALYPLHVGGQDLFPIPPTLIITFEMTMLGLMGFSFIGMLLESRFPSFDAVDYAPEVSDGKIAIFFHCPAELQNQVISALTNAGAESVKPVEAQTP
jgi:hypothetical protein